MGNQHTLSLDQASVRVSHTPPTSHRRLCGIGEHKNTWNRLPALCSQVICFGRACGGVRLCRLKPSFIQQVSVEERVKSRDTPTGGLDGPVAGARAVVGAA